MKPELKNKIADIVQYGGGVSAPGLVDLITEKSDVVTERMNGGKKYEIHDNVWSISSNNNLGSFIFLFIFS